MSERLSDPSAAPKRIPRILVVDDEPDLRELLELTLVRMGLEVDATGSLRGARNLLQSQHYALCLTDMRLPDGLGLELVEELTRARGPVPVAVITAFGNTENAVAALKAGAFDYLSKPLELDALRELVKSALRLPMPQVVKHAALNGFGVAEQDAVQQAMAGVSPTIQEIRQTILKLARSNAPVALTGESGSGKELAARLIHQTSVRKDQPFIAVNCGAIPESLMEAEFFGYRKGAFTGAESDRDGFFQAAQGGTLFLDEVADLPLSMQVKLLRVIQERKVRKIGAPQEQAIDVRIVSATHKDLAQCVAQGAFRQDLFYRLHVISLRMPALRERVEDIPMLAAELLQKIVTRNNLTDKFSFDPAAFDALCRYAFPGNVRELENIIERALALHAGEDNVVLGPADLELDTPLSTDAVQSLPVAAPATLPGDLGAYLDEIERQILLRALEQTEQNRTAAAKLLGISFRQMRYRLQRLGIV